jgi:hypothetical protein
VGGFNIGSDGFQRVMCWYVCSFRAAYANMRVVFLKEFSGSSFFREAN